MAKTFKLSLKEQNPNFYEDSVKIELATRTLGLTNARLCGKRTALIFAYMRAKYPKLRGVDIFETEEIIQKEREISGFIDLCIDDERKFIEPDKNDANMVCLTRNGIDFSEPFGLIKEYVRSIGPFWSIIATIITTLITTLLIQSIIK